MIKKHVEVTGAGDCDACDLVNVLEFGLEFFGDRTRCEFFAGGLFDEFREFKRNGKRDVAEFRFRWCVGVELLYLDAEDFACGGANAVFELLLQVQKGHDKSAEYSVLVE